VQVAARNGRVGSRRPLADCSHGTLTQIQRPGTAPTGPESVPTRTAAPAANWPGSPHNIAGHGAATAAQRPIGTVQVTHRNQGGPGWQQRSRAALEDDLDGGPAAETLRFAISGSEYEIDLSKKNAKTFRKRLAPFIEHARKAARGQLRRPARTTSARQRSADIRAWAKDKGIPVRARGRIPARIVEQYEAANR
jgi:hypothetical protein